MQQHNMMPRQVLHTVAAFALWTTCSLAAVSTSQNCYTKNGLSSLATVPTKTTRLTTSATQTLVHWITPKTTITPQPFVTNVTVTNYDATVQEMPQITDTAFITVTSTDISTSVLDTVTLEAVSTSTTYTIIGTTTTIPTPSGFLPVSSSIPQAQQAIVLHARSIPDAVAHHPRSGSLFARAAAPVECPPGQTATKKGVCMNFYPQEVDCTIYVNKYMTVRVTSTQSTTKTIMATTPTVTSTSTALQTLTVTVTLPDALTTSTITDVVEQTVTSTPSTTTTTTTLDLETLYVPTATSHAICNTPDNFKNATHYGVDTYAPFNDRLKRIGYTSFQVNQGACCEACAADPACEISAYQLGSSSTSSPGTCTMSRLAASLDTSPPTCPADGSSGSWMVIVNLPSASEPFVINNYVVSNGYCGQFIAETQAGQ